MTLDEIKAVVVAADPHAGHYESAWQGTEAYTVWREIRRLPIVGDGVHVAEAWAFQVDRFTKAEGDAVAAALWAALDADPRIACHYDIDNEPETGYIHHIFDCEGI